MEAEQVSINPNQGEIRLALAEYLRQDQSIDLETRKNIRAVTSWMDDTISYGSCETCYYEQAVVRVFYVTWDDERGEKVIEDSFAYLISDLDRVVSEYGEGQ